MLLTVDVGNSQIYCGVFEGETLRVAFRRTSTSRASSDEFGIFLRAALREHEIDPVDVKRAAICSVVPEVVHSLRNGFRKYFGFEPLLLEPGTRTGLKIRYRNPLEVGADKIANAVGAVERFPGRHLLIIDFGTATTICAVNRSKEYLGGVIMPGMSLAMAALESNTARLPTVEILKPSQTLGTTTVESIQSGIYYGTLGAIRALAAAVAREHFANDPPLLIGTGGFGRLFENEALLDAFIPELPLLGLRKVVELSSEPSRPTGRLPRGRIHA